jgi:hypothetical protein
MAGRRSPFYLRPVSDGSEPIAPLSIEELETGLRLLGRGDIDHNCFWDKNIEAFRRTVLVAIRDTSDALLSPRITLRWRLRLERQLEALVQYIELADRYVAKRSLTPQPEASELRSPPSRAH